MVNRLQLYLKKQAVKEQLIDALPNKHLALIVTIPAINEPAIINTLQSLKNCLPAKLPTEVIVFINNSSNASSSIVAQNTKAFDEVNQWILANGNSQLCFHCLYIDDLSIKDAGAGLARKIVMDEAVRRFAQIENAHGVIAALDADALVSPNYIVDLQETFAQQPKLNGAHFYFEHPLDVNSSTESIEPIVLYELYLRYYKQALATTGFPFPFYTVGSCFAVRAMAYVKQGGMNKRQAGEDFYFLNKIYQLGQCLEMNRVTVYPSSRNSDRVPFGTGAAINKIKIEGQWLTYQPVYFAHLRNLFQQVSILYRADSIGVTKIFESIDLSLQQFISHAVFEKQIADINNNTASQSQFVQRFFRWFDAFMIIKYLNQVHNTIAQKLPIEEVSREFLANNLGIQLLPSNAVQLLIIYRNLEKNKAGFKIN